MMWGNEDVSPDVRNTKDCTINLSQNQQDTYATKKTKGAYIRRFGQTVDKNDQYVHGRISDANRDARKAGLECPPKMRKANIKEKNTVEAIIIHDTHQ